MKDLICNGKAVIYSPLMGWHFPLSKDITQKSKKQKKKGKNKQKEKRKSKEKTQHQPVKNIQKLKNDKEEQIDKIAAHSTNNSIKSQKPSLNKSPMQKKESQRKKQRLNKKPKKTLPRKRNHNYIFKKKAVENTGFSNIVEIKKDSINFTDSLKVKFIINKISEKEYDEKFFYKIYIQAEDEKLYLINSGAKKLNNQFKLSATVKFGKIPPTSNFTFYLELIYKKLVIYTCESEEIDVDDDKAIKNIRFFGVSSNSLSVIPENPFIFWVHYYSKPIPSPRPMEIIATMEIKGETIAETSYNMQVEKGEEEDEEDEIDQEFDLDVGGPEELYGVKRQYPFSFDVPDFNGDDVKIQFHVEVIDSTSKSRMFSKTILTTGFSSLKGIKFNHIGYKKGIELGDTAYMVADLQNKTNYYVKGKAVFQFYTPTNGFFKCFKRKFFIDPNNYAKISEDITLKENFGGMDYFVDVRTSFKIKELGKFSVEGISDMRTAKISADPHFSAKLYASLPEDQITFNQIIPIGVDVRISAKTSLHNVVCEVVENYENLRKRIINSFKVKDLEAFHHSFHWKTPSKYGKYNIYTQFKVDGNKVLPINTKSEQLIYDIYPKEIGN
jgi:hypothetical protein